MAPCHRSAVATATPETIWKTCFVPMKWESWDDDVAQLLEVSGPCENGTTFTFDMKDGKQALCRLSSVVENETLTYSGTFYSGMIGYKGILSLRSLSGDDGVPKTKIDYTFDLVGLTGYLIMAIKPDPVVHGTETGLANIVRLSEEAQQG